MELHDSPVSATFSIKFPRVSVSMLDEKIDCIVRSRADTVIVKHGVPDEHRALLEENIPEGLLPTELLAHGEKGLSFGL
jgi:hypothetical protein